jgi:hypothetical protein
MSSVCLEFQLKIVGKRMCRLFVLAADFVLPSLAEILSSPVRFRRTLGEIVSM